MVKLEEENQVRFLKIVVFGERGVGKGTLKQRFAQTVVHDEGVGIVFGSVTVTKIGDCSYRVIFWIFPTAGGRYNLEQITKAYVSRAAGAIFVFDSTRLATLERIDWWVEQLFSVVGKVPILMIENKTDLESQIPRSMVKSYAEKYGAECIQTGFHDTDNTVEKAIERLLMHVVGHGVQ